MVRNNCIFYCFITFLVMFLGILSRKIEAIPILFGDILYAVMVYFGCRFLFIKMDNFRKIIFPLFLCYGIELQQLYNAKWIVEIRNTTLGHYVLGQGFLWSDLVCYTSGIVMAFAIDFLFLTHSNLKSKI
jgi:hypothetical protein